MLINQIPFATRHKGFLALMAITVGLGLQSSVTKLSSGCPLSCPRVERSARSTNTQTFGGIGARVWKDYGNSGRLTVKDTIDGSPAEAAGLECDDVIVRIDGQDPSEMSVSDGVGLIRGTAGSQVRLEILRPETNQRFDLTLVRATIEVDSQSVDSCHD